MVAYFAFEPKGVTTAAVTGFFAGFATESVLLLLRGMFNGLRPESTKPAAAVSGISHLHVSVTLPGGGAAARAAVEIRRLPSDTPVVSQASDANGEISLMNLAPGTVWVKASLTDGTGNLLTAPTQKILLKSGETEAVVLALV